MAVQCRPLQTPGLRSTVQLVCIATSRHRLAIRLGFVYYTQHTVQSSTNRTETKMVPAEAQICSNVGGNNRRCFSRAGRQGEADTTPGASAPASALAQAEQEQTPAPASCETWSALDTADCGASATKFGQHGRGSCCRTEPPKCDSITRSCEADIAVEALEGSDCCKVEQSKDRFTDQICEPKEAGEKVEGGGNCCKIKQPNCKSANIGRKEEGADDESAVDGELTHPIVRTCSLLDTDCRSSSFGTATLLADDTLCPCCVHYVLENSETAISESCELGLDFR